jgi:hypothetical protein
MVFARPVVAEKTMGRSVIDTGHLVVLGQWSVVDDDGLGM